MMILRALHGSYGPGSRHNATKFTNSEAGTVRRENGQEIRGKRELLLAIHSWPKSMGSQRAREFID